MVEASLNSMVGLTNSKTLEACGNVGEKPVVVLIGLGATRNLISKKLIDVLKILVSITIGYGCSWEMEIM